MTRRDKGIMLWKTVALVVILLALGSATYAVTSLDLKDITPSADAWTNKREVHISAKYEGVVGTSTILVDGAPLATEVQPGSHEILATATDLKDGEHEIEIRAGRALGIGTISRSEKINVDAQTPIVTISEPKQGTVVNGKSLKLVGRTKPGARVVIRDIASGHSFEASPATAAADGTFTATVDLADDKNKVRVDVVDRAGNHNVAVRNVTCDLFPPVITQLYPTPGQVIKLNPDVTITAEVEEKGSGVKRATLTLDGQDHPIDLPIDGGHVAYKALDLPEGTRSVALEVEDKAGWKTRQEWKFLVNTTETFGLRPTTMGAIGQDVAVLQKRLIKKGDLAKGHVTSVFDDETEKAVQQFQAEHDINVDGVVGLKTVAAMSPHIVIDLSKFSLALKDGDKTIKTYGIACGMPQFPTPTGNYHVIFLEKNPTWIPPKDSVWAKDAQITPPGAGNPLGTRWIGLDSSAVGIHGTPAAWSIGSRASHGCIRMRIPDVEDLFGRINPGTAVSITAGHGHG